MDRTGFLVVFGDEFATAAGGSSSAWTRRVAAACLALVAMCISAPPGRGAEIDRLLVAVNGRVVTLSDLELAQKLNALLDPRTSAGGRSQRKEMARLVEQELLRQELWSLPTVRAQESEVDGRIDLLRDAFAEIGGLPSLLEHLGLQGAELRNYIELQISLEKFVAFRFRPFVTITEQEIREYFEQKLRPELARAPGAALPELAEVSAQIERVLVEEKVNTSMERWITDVTSHSRIEYFPGPGEEHEEGNR